ncbi:hypothetical protein [Rhizobium sp. BG4]|uniref:hypothetical protein n=1 Tax=Rhizobium sp. BG4 TaxID=2613770 RepID=UPI00193EB6B9|nr:hypothetical protein [Rhizobium sp. BG4]QRM44642.1 hypothetical protein F2982_15060 [Rhizobium sp. BG4]
MKRFLAVTVVAFLAHSALARDSSEQHETGALAIEHVDFVPSETPGIDNIYLTLWNGVSTDVVVNDFAVTGYGTIAIVASPPNQPPVEMAVSEGALTIPAMSSVSMEQDSVYFRATRSAADIGIAVVTLSLSDGTRVTRFVMGPETNSIAAAHQHGEE